MTHFRGILSLALHKAGKPQFLGALKICPQSEREHGGPLLWNLFFTGSFPPQGFWGRAKTFWGPGFSRIFCALQHTPVLGTTQGFQRRLLRKRAPFSNERFAATWFFKARGGYFLGETSPSPGRDWNLDIRPGIYLGRRRKDSGRRS